MKLDINNYPGSKASSGLWQFIINHIPKNGYFYECFAGSAKITEKLVKSNFAADIVLIEKSTKVFNQLYDKYEDNHKVFLKRLDGIEFITKNINKGNRYKDTFLYFDPPYLKHTRKSQVDIYEHEFSDKDHEAFFDFVRSIHKNTNADFMISHYPCKEYDDLAMELNLTYKDFTAMTRGGASTERIYMNYDISERQLACSDYVGHGRQERQRISRKKKRWAKALQEMPLHEKQAVLDELNRIEL